MDDRAKHGSHISLNNCKFVIGLYISQFAINYTCDHLFEFYRVHNFTQVSAGLTNLF